MLEHVDVDVDHKYGKFALEYLRIYHEYGEFALENSRIYREYRNTCEFITNTGTLHLNSGDFALDVENALN